MGAFEQAQETLPVMSMFANREDCELARQRHMFNAGMAAANSRAELLRGWLEDIMQHASCDDCYAERKVLQAIEQDERLKKG